MKLNWGWGIAIAYSTFALALIAFLIYSTTLNRDLVSDNYYEEDAKYQEKIEKVERTKNLDNTLKIYQSNGEIIFEYPKQFKNSEISGEVLFFRPSSEMQDRKFIVKADTSNMQFMKEKVFEKGKWRVKVNWKADTTYYTEQIIMIE